MDDKYEAYKASLRQRTVKQLDREIESWRRYFSRHTSAYAWHGISMTAPGALADGDRFSACREVREEKCPQLPRIARQLTDEEMADCGLLSELTPNV